MQAAPGAGLPPVHPIDHGYAWTVALGAFGLHFFVSGGMRSTGLLFIEVVELYKADKGLTALVIALMAFGYAVFAAVGNAVGTMTTMRRAALIGSVLIFLGLLLTFAAGNILVVILSLGLLSGIGYGFAYGPSLVLVGQYFNNRRALAMGIATAGGSTGTLIIPLFLNYTLTNYGYHGGLLLYSALSLHAIPAAMLLRPTAFYEVKRRRNATALTAPLAVPSDNNNSSSEEGQRRSNPGDRETRFKLVGSQLYPAISEISLFDSNELLAEATAEAAAAAPETGSAPGTVSGPSQAAPAVPPKVTLGLALRMFRKRLFDPDLLHSYGFFAFALGISLGQAGFVDACFFLPPYAVERWGSKKLATLLITLLGISDLIGRVGGGWFADLGLVKRPLIVAMSFIVSGLSIFAVTFFQSFIVMAIATVVLGCLGGCYLALLAVIIADLFGVDKLAPGVGLVSLFMGLTILPCPPILGTLQKVAGSFSITLQLSGVLLFCGGLAFFAIPKMLMKDAARKQAKQQPTAAEKSTMLQAGQP